MSKARKKLYAAMAIYFLIVISMIVSPPSVALWNKINPHVLGLPFSQFSVIAFALLLVVGLLSWFIFEGILNAKERLIRERGEELDY